MERKSFLAFVGLGATSVIAGCLGCTKSTGGGGTGPSNVDFTVDLSLSSNAALLDNGGYVYRNGIIIARTVSGSYIAVQQVCTHQSFSVIYQGAQHQFFCGGHGGVYAENGQVISGPPPAALKTYNTSLSGNSLRIFS